MTSDDLDHPRFRETTSVSDEPRSPTVYREINRGWERLPDQPDIIGDADRASDNEDSFFAARAEAILEEMKTESQKFEGLDGAGRSSLEWILALALAKIEYIYHPGAHANTVGPKPTRRVVWEERVNG